MIQRMNIFASTMLVLCCLHVSVNPLLAVEPTPEQVDFFRKKIEPVLKRECYQCHSQQAKEVEGEFLLDNRANLLKGGPSGRAVVPGKVEESLLINALRHVDFEMPEEQLPKETIADFEHWIKTGAVDPREGEVIELAVKEFDYTEGRKFWSFQPLAEVSVPKPKKNANWARSDVDAYILKGLEPLGLAPNREADPRTLIRRAYFDILGLPPTPEQVEAFVSDDSADAFARLVEHLLKSDHYGERWGRHWLDVTRFGESHGYESDNDRSDAYVYRDAVIKALNQDLPFDKFVQWQIAGDEYEPKNELARQLTGFCGAGPTLTNEGGDRVKYEKLDDIVSTAGEAFLGMTLGCARCHDHKFDPVTSKDYYRFAGVFGTMKIDGKTSLASENGRRPAGNYFLYRGDFRSKSKIDIGFLSVLMSADKTEEHWLKEAPKEINSTYTRHSAGEWMTDTEHGAGSLLARVIVNRLWQHHFGVGIVATSNDFGSQGAKPSHPELLDYLARRLVEGGWKLKPIHQLIMTSAVYMQSTETDANKQKKDPKNRWLARRRPMRLEAEAVRDCLLAVSGCLNRQMHGASVKPWIPTDAISTGSTKKWPVNVKDGPNTWRRSIYIYTKRSMLMPMLQSFDFPDSTKSCAVRNTTTVAPAALLIMNNEFIRDQATRFAQRIQKQVGDDDERLVQEIYYLALARTPDENEMRLGIEFINTQALTYVPDGKPESIKPEHRMAALVNYCQAVFGLNEFIYID